MNKLQQFVTYVFNDIPPIYLIVGSTVVFIVMGTLAFIVRSKASARPISPKRIILPPMFMSTGALMFLFVEFRVPFTQVLEASLVGLLFSLLLIRTTNFEQIEEKLYVKKSKVFLFILFALLVIRMIAKLILSSSIDVGELAGMFWILAFAMIVPWRIGMLVKYYGMVKNP
ncbi:cytochrome c biogenesis protein CcdC [Sporosarcina oncorhynchi]|uniref:Cytochrome c biogenesis protein CcdC n=1 Tax=Sporosarcina oncorhynchi TaxID=3056444 RepID=A0ABZ0LBL5_9BACL|nr:cytochrome c biogenesis protein CcdC [Sporosarcina sp. T2O-4]WOV89044.1 cytochrome c biogenesis protein CcdC [Sporosarcina sp. T2O-4]